MSFNQDSAELRAPKRLRIPALSVFQIRDYRILWGSTSLGNICMFMDIVVLGLLVLRDTDSAFWVALVGALRFMPWLFFGIFAGLIADRANRLRVMIVARSVNVLVMVIVLILVVTDSFQPWHALLTSLAVGWAFVLDIPSRHSFIYDLVGPQNLVRGISLDSMTFTVGIILGPLSAGLFVELTGFTGAYAFLLALYVLSLIGISRVKGRMARPSTILQPVWQSLVGSVRYALRSRTIRAILGVTLIMNFMAFSAMQLYPVVARDHLNVGPGLTGVLISAAGFGTLLGATTIVYLGTTRYHGRIFVLGSSVHLIGLLLFSLSPWYGLSFLMLLMVGLGSSGFSTMQNAITLLASAPERRGATLGVLGLCIGVGPLGTLTMGALANYWNTQAAIGIGAATGLLLLLPIIFLSPLMWRPIPLGTDVADRPGESAATAHVPPLPTRNTGEGIQP